jgi:polysaccharide biosynthesis transport protein
LTEPTETPTGSPEERLAESSRLMGLFEEPSLKELALVPWKRKAVVAGCVFLGALASLIYCFAMHPQYRATTLIEINEEKSSGANMLSSSASMGWDDSDDLKTKLDTEIAIIKDNSIALAVMSKMGMLRLENPNRFSKEEGPVVSVEALPAKRRENLIGNFEGHLQVKEIKDSRLVAITYTSTNPEEAAKIANQVVAEYKSYLLTSNFNSSKDVSQ